MLKLSIIIPIYNVEKYIEECLESVLSQITPDIEVVVVNDGTPDNSMTLVETILNQYSQDIQDQFVIINQSNQGLSCARNAGLDIAKGEYVGFLDSDDKLLSRYIELVLEVIEKTNCDIIDFNILTSQNDILDLRPEANNSLDSVFKAGHWYSWARVVKKDLFSKFRFTPNIYYEDFDLTPLLYLSATTINHINEPLYWYRKNDEGITLNKSQSNNQKTLESIQIIMKKYLSLFNSTNNPYYAYLVVNSLYMLHITAIKRLGIKEALKFLKYNQAVFNDDKIQGSLKDDSISQYRYRLFYKSPKCYLVSFAFLNNIREKLFQTN